jgi:hypothetical protein
MIICRIGIEERNLLEKLFALFPCAHIECISWICCLYSEAVMCYNSWFDTYYLF